MKTNKLFKATVSILIILTMLIVAVPTFAADDTGPVWPVGGNGGKDLKNWHTYSSGKYHSGTDISATSGTEVYAAYSGTVDKVESKKTSYGNHVIIKSTVNSQTVYIYYCHLKGYVVKKNQKVTAGQLIGHVGATGNATGPHLHYEVRNKDKHYGNNSSPTLDPHKYLPGSKPVKPAAPTITKCKAASDTSVDIQWNTVSGASKYKIVRHENDNKNKKNVTDNCTKTSFTDKGLESGHTYYYVVYAYKDKKWSDASKEYKTYTKPSKPAVKVNADSDTQLTVTWDKVQGATKYELRYKLSTEGADKWKTLSSNLTERTYTHKKLSKTTKYQYQVRAIREGNIGPSGGKKNTQVKSDYSSTVSKFTKMPEPKNSVDGANGGVVLEWSQAHVNYNYEYGIYRKAPNEGGFKHVGTTKNLTYTDTTAASGTVYKYQVKILNKDNSYSVAGGSDEFYAAPKITKAITLTPQSTTSMKISWDRPSSEVGLKYIVKKTVNGNTVDLATTNNTSYVDNNLIQGETYRYYIQVQDSAGNYLTSTNWNSAALNIEPSQVTVDKTEIGLKADESVTLNALVKPDNSFNKTITWGSSNNSVATVDSNGVVTAISAGTADIKATTVNGKEAVCKITVTAKETVHTHDYGEWEVETEATCEEPGLRTRTCKDSSCGEIEKATIQE